jgi:NADH dehydrogenase [ubiquinone] 1 alpha subcomplex assembly factor 7
MTATANELHILISRMIAVEGPLSIARYMEMALQHPDYGYYRARDPLGQSGDFTTAPEVSQMFGELIGLWCVDAWQKMGCPDPFILLELGPGRGTLLQDALRAAAVMPGFLQAKQLHLFESNQVLRRLQLERLAAHGPRWIDKLEELPAMPVIFIANEFFDALPIRQFERTPRDWSERMIAADEGKLKFTLTQPDPAITMMVPDRLRAAPVGSVIEVSPPAQMLMAQLAKHIAG